MNLKIIFIIFLNIILNSCKPSDAYLMKIQSHMRTIERADHQTCISQGIDFGEWNDVSTELYWRCRYNLAQDKIIQDATTASDIRNNAMVKKISKKILKNLKRSRQAILSSIESDIEVFDHSKCLSRGYSLDTNDQSKNQQYYECRKKLIYERVSPAPTVTNSYEASNLPDQEFEQYLEAAKQNRVSKGEVNFASNMVNKYPRCRKVNVKSKFFRQCFEAQDRSIACLDKLVTVKAKKQLDDKIYCQQQSFIQFPDNYSITKNKSAKEIERILQEQREAYVKKLEEEKEASINRTLQFFEEGHVSQDSLFRDNKNISDEQQKKEELYKKIQILGLREEFITKCNELTEQKLPDYIEEKTKECIAIGENWNKITNPDGSEIL